MKLKLHSGGKGMLKIEAFEMWIRRRIEGITWKDRTSNKKMLKIIKKEDPLLRRLSKEELYRLHYFNCVTYGEWYAKKIESNFERKRSSGIKRIEILGNLAKGKKFQSYKRTNK